MAKSNERHVSVCATSPRPPPPPPHHRKSKYRQIDMKPMRRRTTNKKKQVQQKNAKCVWAENPRLHRRIVNMWKRHCSLSKKVKSICWIGKMEWKWLKPSKKKFNLSIFFYFSSHRHTDMNAYVTLIPIPFVVVCVYTERMRK